MAYGCQTPSAQRRSDQLFVICQVKSYWEKIYMSYVHWIIVGGASERHLFHTWVQDLFYVKLKQNIVLYPANSCYLIKHCKTKLGACEEMEQMLLIIFSGGKKKGLIFPLKSVPLCDSNKKQARQIEQESGTLMQVLGWGQAEQHCVLCVPLIQTQSSLVVFIFCCRLCCYYARMPQYIHPPLPCWCNSISCQHVLR